MFKKFKTIFKVIEWVLFVFLISILFIIISPKLPIKNIPKSFVVVSGSMEPTIKTGSIAFTRDIDSKTIKAGDIIAFTSPSDAKDTILHRVSSISSTDPLLFKTKGDNNNDIDAWDVQDVGVKGIYFFAIPYLGSLAAAIRQPLGFSLIIGIPALIFIVLQIFNIKKAIDEEINRKVSQKLNESKEPKTPKPLFKSFIFMFLFSGVIYSLSLITPVKALYSNTVVVSGITISVADFTKPSVPVLAFPANNSTTTTNGLIMDWEDSNNYQNSNSIYYVYQSSRLNDFSTIAGFRSSLLVSEVPAPGTPNGVYYWQVKACFSVDNCSEWSEIWKVTIDSTFPTSVITRPWNSDNDNDVIYPIIWYWDGIVEGTASDNFELDHVELSIYRSWVDKYWDGSTWINGTEETVRVDATGTTNWSYKIDPIYLPFGKFKIIAHAVDKAGNIENSATIEFEYTNSPATDINIVSSRLANKINLEITNISSPVDYEILYIGNGVEKGIFGKITADEIVDSRYLEDLYFGTCTSRGTCTPDIVELGSTITVNLTGDTTLTKTFKY